MRDGNEAERERQRKLVYACFSSIGAAERLLADDPGLPEARDGVGETALHYLAVENQVEAVGFLILRGARVNNQDNFGSTPLHSAAGLDYAPMARLLLGHGADVRASDQFGDTPLHRAAQTAGAEMIALLLEAGADLEARNGSRETPLHAAAAWGNLAAARRLLEAGADVAARASFGDTPILGAVGEEATVDMLDLLERFGARIDDANACGQTLVHSAAYHGRTDLLAHLDAKGLDPWRRDANGATPYDEALRGEEQAAADFLSRLRPPNV